MQARAYALKECRVEPMDVMLVAVPPWDIAGARRAGLGAAWIDSACCRSAGAAPDIAAGVWSETLNSRA